MTKPITKRELELLAKIDVKIDPSTAKIFCPRLAQELQQVRGMLAPYVEAHRLLMLDEGPCPCSLCKVARTYLKEIQDGGL